MFESTFSLTFSSNNPSDSVDNIYLSMSSGWFISSIIFINFALSFYSSSVNSSPEPSYNYKISSLNFFLNSSNSALPPSIFFIAFNFPFLIFNIYSTIASKPLPSFLSSFSSFEDSQLLNFIGCISEMRSTSKFIAV